MSEFHGATAEATRAWLEAHPARVLQPLGPTGLVVTQAGFGGYRVADGVGGHQKALRHALQQGINLVDTSTNYTDGGSERLVGQVLAELQAEGVLAREAVVVVSKAGYLQGQNYEISQRRKEKGRPFPDLVELGEGLEHCLHPEFLEDQLTRSLERLRLRSLDVLLLHNPEYYLGWAARAGTLADEAREEYYRRLEQAFRHLEQEVEQGRIGWYGVSSNTFPAPADEPQFTSLDRVLELAAGIREDHHLAVVQLPMNLLERGAAVEANQPDGRSALARARDEGLAVLINRPLNAIVGPELVRLATVAPPPVQVDQQQVADELYNLVGLEEGFRGLLPSLPLPGEARGPVSSAFTVGQMLQARWHSFAGLQDWLDIRGRLLEPRSREATAYLRRMPGLPRDAASWLEGYGSNLEAVFDAVTAYYQGRAAERTAALERAVEGADEQWGAAPNLSRKALRALRTTAGVTCVLVGMRRADYVEEVLAELEATVLQEPREASWARLGEELP